MPQRSIYSNRTVKYSIKTVTTYVLPWALSHQNRSPPKVVPPDRLLQKKWSPRPILAAKIGLSGLILAAKIGPPSQKQSPH